MLSVLWTSGRVGLTARPSLLGKKKARIPVPRLGLVRTSEVRGYGCEFTTR